MTLRRWLVAYLVVVHLLVAALAVFFLREQPVWLIPVEILLVLSLLAGVFLARRIFGAVAMVREAQQLLDDGDFMSRVREVGQPEVDRIIGSSTE